MAALAAQSEALYNAKLLAAQNLIAKQVALEKQIEADRLMEKQVERDDKREDDRQEVIRLKLAQEMVDREGSERARKENTKTLKTKADEVKKTTSLIILKLFNLKSSRAEKPHIGEFIRPFLVSNISIMFAAIK